jgi:hypothetical protein
MNSGLDVSHNSYVVDRRRKVLDLATDILGGRIGLIEGSRALSHLRHEVEVKEPDRDFLIFVGVDSETDHLPIGEERKSWDAEALAAKDQEIQEFEASVREDIMAACRNLIARFS